MTRSPHWLVTRPALLLAARSHRWLAVRTPILLAVLALFAAAPAAAGPPWIAIEYPANPHHPSTRGATLLVRGYHHSTALALPVRGTAEGIINGKRVSRPLDLRPTNMPGVYALRSELPEGGTWVLAISLEQSEDIAATALVTLDGKGGIAHVEVPSTTSRDGWVVPRAIKPADIERALQVAAVTAQRAPAGERAVEASSGSGRTSRTLLASVLGLPLLIGLVARRRRWLSTFRNPLLLAALALTAASPAAAKIPWIAIEYPANPHHASTRAATLLVRTYRDTRELAMAVRGTAEGVVNGKRVTRRLDLRPTNMVGVYALRSELPRGGTWVLAISVAAAEGKEDIATAVVTLDGKGGIARVEVPATRSADGSVIPRPAGQADVERALQLAAAAAGEAAGLAGSAEATAQSAAADRGVLLAGMLGLPLLLGLFTHRRARR